MVVSERNSRAVTLLRHLVRSHQRLRAADAAECQALGLSSSEFDVIATLGNTDGLRMCDLASKTLMSPPNITRVVKRLAERGWVTRLRSPTCEREVVAKLTDEGERVFAQTYPVVVRGLRDDIDQRLTPAEQDALIALLLRLTDDDASDDLQSRS